MTLNTKRLGGAPRKRMRPTPAMNNEQQARIINRHFRHHFSPLICERALLKNAFSIFISMPTRNSAKESELSGFGEASICNAETGSVKAPPSTGTRASKNCGKDSLRSELSFAAKDFAFSNGQSLKKTFNLDSGTSEKSHLRKGCRLLHDRV